MIKHDMKKFQRGGKYLVTGLILGLVTLNAQERIVLDLDKVRDLALENNSQVKLAEKAVQKSEQDVVNARGNLLPSLSGYANYQKSWELAKFYFAGNYITVGSENAVQSGLTLTQPLFLGGAAWDGYQISKLGRSLVENQQESTRTAVLLDATGAYYGLLFANSVVDVMQSTLATAEENLKQVQEFLNAGKASDFDVLRAEVQVATIQPQVISAKNSARLAESRLRMVIGVDQSTILETSEKLMYAPSALLHQSLEEVYQQALDRRPEVQSLSFKKSMAQKQLQIARSSRLPSIMMQTAYQYQGQRNDFNFDNNDFIKSFNTSLAFSFPIFNGFQTRANVQKAKIGLGEVDDQQEALLRGIRMEVEGAYFTMQEAEEKVTAQTKLVEQATEAFRLASLRYQEGASTQLDVMNSELALSQAKMTYQQSLLEYNLALAGLEKALNQL